MKCAVESVQRIIVVILQNNTFDHLFIQWNWGLGSIPNVPRNDVTTNDIRDMFQF